MNTMIDRMIYECQRVSEIRRRMINPRPKMRTTNFLRKSPSFGSVILSQKDFDISATGTCILAFNISDYVNTISGFREREREREKER